MLSAKIPDTTIQLIAEDAIMLRFDLSPENAQSIENKKSLAQHIGLVRSLLLDHFAQSFVELIPSYSSLLIIVDFPRVEPEIILHDIKSLVSSKKEALIDLSNANTNRPETIEIPVYYGEEVALDLKALSDTLNLAPEKIIQLHKAQEYTVCALGFSPGFAYLGFVDERIACARKSTPRAKVAKGSVGIADQQSGIYPMQSPGGWNIIGRTNFPLFSPSAEPSKLCPLKVGDRVRFIEIDKHSFLDQGGSVDD